MAYKLSPALAQAAHNGPGIKPALEAADGFFVHFFAGPEPSTPGDALDMVDDHTLLGTVSVDGDGTTGMSFDDAAGAVLSKAATETWGGTFSFSGAEDGAGTLDCAFFRVAPKADNCQGAGAGARLQGTVTATGGGGDMERATTSCVDGQPIALSSFVVRLGSIG